jgi:arginase
VAGLDAAALPGGPWYVHLDLDVIDPAEVPGLRYPAPGGPGSAEVAGALRMLLATGGVAAVGIACTWHPGHSGAASIGPHLKAVFATVS